MTTLFLALALAASEPHTTLPDAITAASQVEKKRTSKAKRTVVVADSVKAKQKK